jgi:hypothetical protein
MAASMDEVEHKFIFCDESLSLLQAKSHQPLAGVHSFTAQLRFTKEWKLTCDASFARSMEIHDIKKANKEELLACFSVVEEKEELYKPFRSDIEAMQQLVVGKKKEIENRRNAKPKKKKETSLESAVELQNEQILKACEDLEQLEKELEDKLTACEPYHAYMSAVNDYEQLKLRLGITRLREEIAIENKKIGRSTSEQGNRLETIMTDLLPSFQEAIAKQYGLSSFDHVAMLTSIGSKTSLAFAAAEFDGWLVEWRESEIGDASVRFVTRVLAIIEAKNNPNDIGTSFVHFQQSLAFLTNTLPEADRVRGGGVTFNLSYTTLP